MRLLRQRLGGGCSSCAVLVFVTTHFYTTFFISIRVHFTRTFATKVRSAQTLYYRLSLTVTLRRQILPFFHSFCEKSRGFNEGHIFVNAQQNSSVLFITGTVARNVKANLYSTSELNCPERVHKTALAMLGDSWFGETVV